MLPAYSYYQMWSKDRSVSSWIKTKGKIITIEDNAEFNGMGVMYSYLVSKKQYFGHRVAFTSNHLPKAWGDEKRSQWIREKFLPGEKVDILYEPSNPLNSVLLGPILEENDIGFVILLVFTSLVTGAFGIFFYWYRNQNKYQF